MKGKTWLLRGLLMVVFLGILISPIFAAPQDVKSAYEKIRGSWERKNDDGGSTVFFGEKNEYSWEDYVGNSNYIMGGTFEIILIFGKLHIRMTELSSASKYGGVSAEKKVHDPEPIKFIGNKLFIGEIDFTK